MGTRLENPSERSCRRISPLSEWLRWYFTSLSCPCKSKTGRKYFGAAVPTATTTSLDLLGTSSKARVEEILFVYAPRREYYILNDGEVTCCGAYIHKDLKKDGNFVACNWSFSEPFDKYRYSFLHMICLRTSADFFRKASRVRFVFIFHLSHAFSFLLVPMYYTLLWSRHINI